MVDPDSDSEQTVPLKKLVRFVSARNRLMLAEQQHEEARERHREAKEDLRNAWTNLTDTEQQALKAFEIDSDG